MQAPQTVESYFNSDNCPPRQYSENSQSPPPQDDQTPPEDTNPPGNDNNKPANTSSNSWTYLYVAGGIIVLLLILSETK